jgi:hypothetical protein
MSIWFGLKTGCDKHRERAPMPHPPRRRRLGLVGIGRHRRRAEVTVGIRPVLLAVTAHMSLPQEEELLVEALPQLVHLLLLHHGRGALVVQGILFCGSQREEESRTVGRRD